MKLSDADGNKLAGLFFPKATLPARGSFPWRAFDQPQRDAEAASDFGCAHHERFADPTRWRRGPEAAQLQGQGNRFEPGARTIPARPLLSALGGEPRANLRVSASLAADSARIEARELSAETPGNLTAGHLSSAWAASRTSTPILSPARFRWPSLLSYFLPACPGTLASALPASLTPASAAGYLERAAVRAVHVQGNRRHGLAQRKEHEAQRHAGPYGRHAARDPRPGRLNSRPERQGAWRHARRHAQPDGQGQCSAAQAGLTLSDADLSALANPGTAPLVTGQASLSIKATGQGLSPRGLISVLHGRGAIRLGGGQLSRLAPHAVQARADELLAQSLPLTEEAITKSALEAVQSKDFKYRKLVVPVTVADGSWTSGAPRSATATPPCAWKPISTSTRRWWTAPGRWA